MRLAIKLVAILLMIAVAILFILWPFGKWVKIVPWRWDPYCAVVNSLATVVTIVAMWGVWML